MDSTTLVEEGGGATLVVEVAKVVDGMVLDSVVLGCVDAFDDAEAEVVAGRVAV